MELKQYLKPMSPQARNSFAVIVGSSRGHIQNVAYGYRVCAAELAVSIERETQGVVSRKDLCPDNWQKIWPELAQAPATIAQAATETIAVDAVTSEVGTLRTGVIRRHTNRRAQDLPIDLDRRAAEGPPFQSPEMGVA